MVDDPVEDDAGSITEDELKQKMNNSELSTESNEGGDNKVAEALSDVIGELSSDEEIEMFTDLTAAEIRHLSVLVTAGDEITKRFARHYMKQKISFRRRGRGELIEVSDSIGDSHQMDEESSRIQKLKQLV